MTDGSNTERSPWSLKKRAADAFCAVFLPAAGYRNGTDVNNVNPDSYYYRYDGQSVRLVR